MATISNVNGKKITKIKYKGEIYDTGGGGSLKTLLDATKSCYYLFSQYSGTSVNELISYNDTENVTNMDYMFYGCSKLTSIPQLDTSKVTTMASMFQKCSKLTTIPQLNTSKVTNMVSMFQNCSNLTTIPQLNTSEVTNMASMFQNCSNLTTILQLDTSKVTNMSNMFYGCSKLSYLKLLNVKISLRIGSETSYGHLIEKDCLIQIISELIKPSSGTRTLSMGTANIEKLADTYVKLLDDDGSGKYPFAVCKSTDEGAMTITDYCTAKNWTLA